MYRLAIVEDSPEDCAQLRKYLSRYSQELEVEFQTETYPNALTFLMDYKADHDVILLDIEMPHMNGMELARRIRKVDEQVCLIFITSLTKYAIEGYEVQALDYILKPVEYRNFSLKLRRALDIRDKRQTKELVLNTSGGIQRLQIEEIYYIEVIDHALYYHTADQTYEGQGSLKQREETLARYGFARCSNSYLVNLRYVSRVFNGKIMVKDREITIGRTKKKEFMQKLTDYMGDYVL